MSEWAGWIAPAATMIAAMMTAANLGSRVTGWGFAVFVVGSLCWSAVGLASGQTGLLVSNAFLTLVNIVGVWRWLGRQAAHEDGSAAAARRSEARPSVPSLFSASSLPGAPLLDGDGEKLGEVVDAMMRCGQRDIAYVVVARGGVGGIGQRLHALDPDRLGFAADGVRSQLSGAEIDALPELKADEWPAALPDPSRPALAAQPAA